MTRIAMIGAGSVVFVKNRLTDLLSLPELRGCTIALHDIDPERLETAGMMARWTTERLNANAHIEEQADRRRCLADADFVINMVQIGMHQATLLDFEIPRKYGLKQTIADTVGIGGIFRGLCTIPLMMALTQDMHEQCPDALLMNYTNPDEHPYLVGLPRSSRTAGGGTLPQRPVHRAIWQAIWVWIQGACPTTVPASTT
jgi:alpha-galactosidase